MQRRSFLLASATAAFAQPSKSRFVKSICSVSLPSTMPLPEAFKRAKNAGFDAIEIRLGDQLSADSPADDVRRVRQAARETGIAISSVWSSGPLEKFPLNSPNPAVRDKGIELLGKVLQLAASLECGETLLVPGRVTWDGGTMGYRDTWDHSTDALRKALPLAEKSRVIIGVEDVWNKFLVSPLEMRAYVDQFHSPWIQCHFDVGNIVQWGYPQDWIMTLGSRIKRVHLKDFKTGRKGAASAFVPLMEGDVDWKEVMAALVKVGYRGTLSPEYGYKEDDPDQLINLSRAVDKLLAMV